MSELSIRKISFYEKVEGKTQAAFVILYALDGKPWSKYSTAKPELKELPIPTCFMLNRSDGAIGFIGGKVDGDETLEEAAIREVAEEVGYTIEGVIEPVVAHDLGKFSTHAFAMELPYDTLRFIQEKATVADHFGSEVTGVFLPHLIDYPAHTTKHGGVVNLLQSAFAPSVREELVHFLLMKQLFQKDELADLASRAGYSLDELLK